MVREGAALPLDVDETTIGWLVSALQRYNGKTDLADAPIEVQIRAAFAHRHELALEVAGLLPKSFV